MGCGCLVQVLCSELLCFVRTPAIEPWVSIFYKICLLLNAEQLQAYENLFKSIRLSLRLHQLHAAVLEQSASILHIETSSPYSFSKPLTGIFSWSQCFLPRRSHKQKEVDETCSMRFRSMFHSTRLFLTLVLYFMYRVVRSIWDFRGLR